MLTVKHLKESGPEESEGVNSWGGKRLEMAFIHRTRDKPRVGGGASGHITPPQIIFPVDSDYTFPSIRCRRLISPPCSLLNSNVH